MTGQTFCKLAGSGGYFAGSPALQSSCDRIAPHSLTHTPDAGWLTRGERRTRPINCKYLTQSAVGFTWRRVRQRPAAAHTGGHDVIFFIHFILWVNICVSSHVAKRFPPRGGSLFGKISSCDSDPIINSARGGVALSLFSHRAFPLYFANSVSLSKLQLPAEKRNISWLVCVRGDTRSLSA